MKITIIAGYDKSWYSVLIAEKLRKSGIEIPLILIALPGSISRIKTLVRSRGLSSMISYFVNSKSSKKVTLIQKEAQKDGLRESSLKKWGSQNDVPVKCCLDINGRRSLSIIKNIETDLVIYTGGGIIHDEFLSLCKPIVNAHMGKLPTVRGMNAMEWSLILKEEIGVNLHYIDRGIDTGKTIGWYPIDIRKDDTLESLHERMVLASAASIVQWISDGYKEDKTVIKGTKKERQCFVVSSALRELASLRLSEKVNML